MALTSEAIGKIKTMILSGELRAGDRLPNETELAARLGLSRNSLREAVRALEVLRILHVRQGDGTYVTSLKPELLLEAFNFVLDFHGDHSLLHLFEVRRILEPRAAALAATRMNDEDIAALKATLEIARYDMPVEQAIECDVEFHQNVAAGSGNQMLCSIINNVATPTIRARLVHGFTEERAFEQAFYEHRMIYESIADRNPEAASAWASIHISGVEKWLRGVP